MGTLPLPALLLFQDAAATASDVHIIMICEVVLTAIVVVLILALILAGLVINSKIKKLTANLNGRTQPLIARGTQIAGSVNDILTDLKPKIATVSSDLQPKIARVSSDVQHISSLIRSKADEAGLTFASLNQTVQEYSSTAQDVNLKTKSQVARVNEMVSEALTTTQHVSKQIQHGIRVPVERVASWVTAAKVGLETLGEKLPFLNQTPGPRSTANASRPAAGPRPVARPVTTAGPGPRVVHSAADYTSTDKLSEPDKD